MFGTILAPARAWSVVAIFRKTSTWARPSARESVLSDRLQREEKQLAIVLLMQEAGNLTSQFRGLQQLAHRTPVVEEFLAQLCWKSVPLHDQRCAEADQYVPFLHC
jgi:hypothetical protein